MLTIFTNVVLPVLVVAGLGYLLDRTLKPSLPSLSRVTLYVFAPCLVFSSLTKTTLSAQDALQIGLFSFLLTAAMFFVAWAVALAGRFDRALSRAFIISVLFMNAGNYGLSVSLLAFGQPGLERALVFFVTQALFGQVTAVYIAASSTSIGVRAPIGVVLRMPMLYAGLAAIVLNTFQVQPPPFIARSMELAGQGAVPLMLLVLGMQLNQGSAIDAPVAIGLAAFSRLVIAVGVAFGLLTVMGVEGTTRDVLLVLASMPTAVYTIIVATEFDTRPRFMTGVVLVTTVLSIVTTTVLLAILKGVTSLF